MTSTLSRTLIILALALIPALVASAHTPVAFSCPVTLPDTERPPAAIDPFDEDESIHGEDGIWVSIPENGVLTLSPDKTIGFGPYQGWRSTTFTWLRDEGVEGFVVVSGQRLDRESELEPQTPLSPQRQYVQVGTTRTGIAFPDRGCWEITGTIDGSSPTGGDAAITWVMDVRFVDEVATPIA